MLAAISLRIRNNQILSSTVVVVVITFLSRVLGFIRDLVIAQVFGVQAGVDAFLVAYRIPNLLRQIFAEGTFSQAFIPLLATGKTNGSQAETREFIGHMAGTLLIFLTVLTLIILLISPLVIYLSAPGFRVGSPSFVLATEMLRIVFPYLIFIAMAALCGAVLNSYGFFAVPALSSIFLNVAMIGAIWFLAPKCSTPVKALAWGVLLAGIAQWLFQLQKVWREGLGFKMKWAWRDPRVQAVIKRIIPALYGLSALQLHLFLNTLFASFLMVGSISWLYFSVQLINFPVGIFALAVSTVLTPKLSLDYARKKHQAVQQDMEWGMRTMLLLAIPCMLGLIVLSKPILISLFQYGRFAWHDVQMTASALIAYAVGLPAMMLSRILAVACYCQHDYKTPVRAMVLSTLLNIVFDMILIFPFSHVGLAIATTLSAVFQLMYLTVVCIRKGIYRPQTGWMRYVAKLCVAGLLMLLWLQLISFSHEAWLSWHALHRAWHLLMAIGSAAAIYFLVFYALVFGFRWRSVSIQ